MTMVGQRKLQVFVSSTYSDLKDERGAAVTAILKAGHIPAGMELFSAGDKSQLEVIKNWIDESDVYMLILGTRYGSIEPKSQLSYTEVEYDYAISTGKPLFALVMGENVVDQKLRETGSTYIEIENPQKLKVFKDKVLSKICSIYEDTRDIKSHIYESLIDFSKRPDLLGWVRGDAIVDPAPLHARIADLTAENDRFRNDLSEARGKSLQENTQSNVEDEKFLQIKSLLESIVFDISPEISGRDVSVKRSLYYLFVTNRTIWVAGTKITPLSSKKLKWFESNVFSRLVAHKLMRIDRKSSGDKVYALTEEGLDFSSWIDRKAFSAGQNE